MLVFEIYVKRLGQHQPEQILLLKENESWLFQPGLAEAMIDDGGVIESIEVKTVVTRAARPVSLRVRLIEEAKAAEAVGR